MEFSRLSERIHSIRVVREINGMYNGIEGSVQCKIRGSKLTMKCFSIHSLYAILYNILPRLCLGALVH